MRTPILFAVVTAILSTSALTSHAVAGDVTLTITGVQARGGQLLAALQTPAQFLKPEGTYGEIVTTPSAGSVTVVLRDVAPGDYSVAVLHDTDGDGQMKMAEGRPAEGWSMLNAASLRGLPTFDQVRFTVPPSGDVALSLAMDYPAQ